MNTFDPKNNPASYQFQQTSSTSSEANNTNKTQAATPTTGIPSKMEQAAKKTSNLGLPSPTTPPPGKLKLNTTKAVCAEGVKKPPMPTVPRPTIRASSALGDSLKTIAVSADKMAIQGLPPKTSDNPDAAIDELNDSYKDIDGLEIAKESAKLTDTVSIFKRELNSKIAYCEKKLKSIPQTGENQQQTEILNKTKDEAVKRLKRYNIKIDKAQNLKEEDFEKPANKESPKSSPLKSGWTSPMSPRIAFKKNSAISRDEYLPILGDHWNHKLTNNKNEQISGISCSAALTDFAYGEISLQELNDYNDLIKLSTKNKSIDEERKKYLSNLYLLGNNEKFDKNLLNCITDIQQKAIKAYGERVLTNNKFDSAKLSSIIQDREEILSSQMLQDLYVHFKEQPVEGNSALFGRTSLLSITKKPAYQGEFFNSERSQCLDMLAIFDKFNGKEIHFDGEPGSGPFLDETGAIHMPSGFRKQKKGEPAPKEPVKLNAIFVNISGQGKTKNTGVQEVINDKALKQLNELIHNDKELGVKEQDVNKLKINLLRLNDSSTSPMEIARSFAVLFNKLGYATINCFGGKDRTGYEAAEVHSELMEKEIESQTKGVFKDYQKKTMLKIDNQLISKNGIITRKANYNIGFRVLKLSRFNLKLYHVGTPLGCTTRICHYIKNAGLWGLGKMGITRYDSGVGKHKPLYFKASLIKQAS